MHLSTSYSRIHGFSTIAVPCSRAFSDYNFRIKDQIVFFVEFSEYYNANDNKLVVSDAAEKGALLSQGD